MDENQCHPPPTAGVADTVSRCSNAARLASGMGVLVVTTTGMPTPITAPSPGLSMARNSVVGPAVVKCHWRIEVLPASSATPARTR